MTNMHEISELKQRKIIQLNLLKLIVMDNLYKQLINEIQNTMMKHSVSFIVMHPTTLNDILDIISMPKNLFDYRIMGFPIYRSEDVKINQFKVG